MTKYHVMDSCNKCGSKNKVKPIDYVVNSVCEAETECEICGFKDYWSYGFFESSQDIESKCRKY